MKFQKEAIHYENGKKQKKEVPLVGVELIEAKALYLKEKVAKGTSTEEENMQLANLSGIAIDTSKLIGSLITAVGSLVEQVSKIASIMEMQVVTKEEAIVEEEEEVVVK